MKMYWDYFKYIIEHKWNVGIECLKIGLWLHAFTHDLSKFYPSEFFPYAEKFYGRNKKYKPFEIVANFNKAWLHHQHRNRHHWDYWVNSKGEPQQIPNKYILQMIVDWKAMSRKFGDTADSFYRKNKAGMVLHSETIKYIEVQI